MDNFDPYCWLLLQIYLCYLWLLLCSRDTFVEWKDSMNVKCSLWNHQSECMSCTDVFVSFWICLMNCVVFAGGDEHMDPGHSERGQRLVVLWEIRDHAQQPEHTGLQPRSHAPGHRHPDDRIQPRQAWERQGEGQGEALQPLQQEEAVDVPNARSIGSFPRFFYDFLFVSAHLLQWYPSMQSS